MIQLTNKENKLYRNQKVCHICKKQFSTDDKKVRSHCHFTGKYRGAAQDVWNLNYKILKEIPIVFHNGSTYDYHFIIKEPAKEVKEQFQCLGENRKVHNFFSNDNGKKYKIKFIDSFRFMSSSLLSLVDNLSYGLYNDKCIDWNTC